MSDFDWDEANIAHIDVHKVKPYEAEEALTILPLELPGYPAGEEIRIDVVGVTRAGRILKVVTTNRGPDKTRVVTAYDASKHNKRLYLRFMVTQ